MANCFKAMKESPGQENQNPHKLTNSKPQSKQIKPNFHR
jgi:hypothetical protein